MSVETNLRELYGVDEKPEAFDQVSITVSSPEVIRSWSRGEVKNPESSSDYTETVFDLGTVKLEPKDEIKVEFNAVTNGKIPENDETAYSRGRWRGLILTEVR